MGKTQLQIFIDFFFKLIEICIKSASVATFVKARATTIPVSRSNPGGATFANCILGVALAKLRKTKETFADYTCEWDESARTYRGLA